METKGLRKGLRGAVCAVLMLLMLLGGCGEPGGAGGPCDTFCGSIVVDIGDRAWSGPAILSLHNDDTLSLNDVSIFMRCNSRFRDDTLTLRVELFTPDSLHLSEPFLFSRSASMPPASGLLGQGRSALVKNRTPSAVNREIAALYRRRVRLGRSGDYRFVITPSRPVEGIEAAGIHFEPSKQVGR